MFRRQKVYKNICSVCGDTYKTFGIKSKIGLCGFCFTEGKAPK